MSALAAPARESGEQHAEQRHACPLHRPFANTLAFRRGEAHFQSVTSFPPHSFSPRATDVEWSVRVGGYQLLPSPVHFGCLALALFGKAPDAK